MDPAYVYRAYAESVVDGDTYHLRVDLGFHVAITVPVRLRGVDSPEMNTSEGKAARAYAVRLLLPEGRPPTQLMVESYRDRQSFARWVCDVWVGDAALGDLLVADGYARRIDPR